MPTCLPQAEGTTALHVVGATGRSPVLVRAGRTARELARDKAEDPVPKTWALAIGVEWELSFRRGLSPQVARAVPGAVAEVKGWLAN